MAISTHKIEQRRTFGKPAKMRSAMNFSRARFHRRGLVMTGPDDLADMVKGISLAGSVVDTMVILRVSRYVDQRLLQRHWLRIHLSPDWLFSITLTAVRRGVVEVGHQSCPCADTREELERFGSGVR
jgi:hypothetical protein